MSAKKDDTESIRISQVLAGALAAVTAALIGSTMGVAGTVVGAGLASVISTVGGAVYLRSIQRTRESVRTVRAKVVGRSGGATVLVSQEDPNPDELVEADTSDESGGQTSDVRPPSDRRLRWPVVLVTALAAFALGMVAITGVEWLRGESLSGNPGTTFGSVVDPHRDSGGQDPVDPPSTTTPTTSPTAPTSTDKTNTTEQSTTSTPPSSDSSTPSTPPVTTTTSPTTTTGSMPPPS